MSTQEQPTRTTTQQQATSTAWTMYANHCAGCATCDPAPRPDVEEHLCDTGWSLKRVWQALGDSDQTIDMPAASRRLGALLAGPGTNQEHP